MKDKIILVVDDMQFDREIAAKALSQKLGARIITASGGAEALDILENQCIDLVLLDVEMPVMSGDEVIMEIRKKSSLADLPVIIVSGKSQDSIMIKCLKAGANDYIQKPINFEVAMTRIVNHLKLVDAVRIRGQLQEMNALNAMVTTYNHEINNPLMIALAGLAKFKKDGNDDILLKKVTDALERISRIVRLIEEVTLRKEVPFEKYGSVSKMIKLK